MRVSRKASLALAGGMLAAFAVVPTAAHAATATLNITVGGDDEDVNGVFFEGMRFLAPGTVAVHKGDVLTFNFQGFHTATLIPAGEGPQDWRADHTAGVTSDYSLITPDADDPQPQFEFNPAAFFPGDPSCGGADAPCDYNGNSVVNSGVSIFSPSFSVTVNAAPGDTFWVLCLVHSMMEMRVQVVPDNEATTTQTAIDSYAASQLAQDKDDAAAVVSQLQQPASHKTASGATVWDAYAGFDGAGWGLNAMFPKKLKIEKGDKVRWHFGQLLGNIHTVSFPKSQAVALANQFGEPVCEADPTDTPADAPPPAFCSSGPQNLEFHVPAAALLAAGDHKYDGTGFHSSGVEGPDGLSTAAYDLKFTKRSGDTPFKYACIVHGGMMSGKVVVK